MKKKWIACLLLACLLLGGCTPDGPNPTDTDDEITDTNTDSGTDSTTLPAEKTVYFSNNTVTAERGGEFQITLINDTDQEFLTESSFHLTDKNGVEKGQGQIESVTVPAEKQATLTFSLAGILPEAGEYVVHLTGAGSMGVISLQLNLTVTAPRDIQTLPLEELTAEEVRQLGEYLCATYVTCSFGLFDSTAQLSSNSIWNTIQYLNLVLYNDTSDQTRTREDSMAKAALFFEGAEFRPEDVRLYDEETQTFRLPEPLSVDWSYMFLDARVENGQIIISYQDAPDPNDPDSGNKYETVLKKNTQGSFTFVSSKRTTPVG